jgi:hypothetical protein
MFVSSLGFSVRETMIKANPVTVGRMLIVRWEILKRVVVYAPLTTCVCMYACMYVCMYGERKGKGKGLNM